MPRLPAAAAFVVGIVVLAIGGAALARGEVPENQSHILDDLARSSARPTPSRPRGSAGSEEPAPCAAARGHRQGRAMTTTTSTMTTDARPSAKPPGGRSGRADLRLVGSRCIDWREAARASSPVTTSNWRTHTADGRTRPCSSTATPSTLGWVRLSGSSATPETNCWCGCTRPTPPCRRFRPLYIRMPPPSCYRARAGSWRTRTCRAAYRPGKRAVVRVVTPGRVIFLKVLRPHVAEQLHARHAAWFDAGIPVPRAVAWSAEGLMALEPVTGVEAIGMIESLDDGETFGSAPGRARGDRDEHDPADRGHWRTAGLVQRRLGALEPELAARGRPQSSGRGDRRERGARACRRDDPRRPPPGPGLRRPLRPRTNHRPTRYRHRGARRSRRRRRRPVGASSGHRPPACRARRHAGRRGRILPRSAMSSGAITPMIGRIGCVPLRQRTFSGTLLPAPSPLKRRWLSPRP